MASHERTFGHTSGEFGMPMPAKSSHFSRDDLMSSKMGEWLQSVTPQQEGQRAILDTIPDLLTSAFQDGTVGEYAKVLDNAVRTEGTPPSEYWGFKGPERAILEDASGRITAGVLLTKAESLGIDTERGKEYIAAARTMLEIMDIPQVQTHSDLLDVVATKQTVVETNLYKRDLVKKREEARQTAKAAQADAVRLTPFPKQETPKNIKHVSFDTILASAATEAAEGEISELRVANSGIASLLGKLDEGYKIGESKLGERRTRVLRVMTNALNSGVTEIIDKEFHEEMEGYAKVYRDELGVEKQWDTKGLALAGHRVAVAATLRTHANNLTHRENKMREHMSQRKRFYTQEEFEELRQERADARFLADLILPLSEVRVSQVSNPIEIHPEDHVDASPRELPALPLPSSTGETVVFDLTVEQMMKLDERADTDFIDEITPHPFDVLHDEEYYQALLRITKPENFSVRIDPNFQVDQEGTQIPPLSDGRFAATNEDFHEFINEDSKKDTL